jgi:malate-CoA ligase subunit alpha
MEHMSKPLIAYIAGLTAPQGRRMGHAGAIISSIGESAAEKVAMLQEFGVIICPTPAAMGETVAKVLARM